jgi:preprotein translocase subunit SecE
LARTTTRRPEEEEEILEDVADDEEEEEQAVSEGGKGGRGSKGIVAGGKDRPTPSSRSEVARGGNIVSRTINGITTYFRETWAELQKVAWLSREDAIHLTRIVVVVLVVSAMFLGLVGFLFGLLTQAIATEGSSTIAGILTLGLVIVVAGAWLLRDRLFVNRFE